MLHCSYSLYSSCYNNKQHAFHCFLHGTTLLSYTMYPSIWRPPSPRSAGGVGAAAASGCRATARRRRRRHYSDEDEAHGRQQDQAPLLESSEWVAQKTKREPLIKLAAKSSSLSPCLRYSIQFKIWISGYVFKPNRCNFGNADQKWTCLRWVSSTLILHIISGVIFWNGDPNRVNAI